ncbi:MAG: hypothetical protein L0Y56_19840 [Nitrospira sp.]|nr:hypothetical protein [Nitrospira sp.]
MGMHTIMGVRWDIFKPDPNSVYIEDIAHALSNLCRFNGHTREFYSVAQHCVLVSQLLSSFGPAMQLTGLLHDASEAYMGDMIAPIKPRFPAFKRLEKRNMEAIIEGLHLSDTIPHWDTPAIKMADRMVLAAEGRDLMPDGWFETHAEWDKVALPPAIQATVIPWTPLVANSEYVETFFRLLGEME